MVDVRYDIFEEIRVFEERPMTVYGIISYTIGENSVIIEKIHDVSSNKNKVIMLVQLFNDLELSTIHLADVVMDMIG